MTTYYKATRPDGTSFYDSTTTWKVGRITRHPNPDTSKGLCSSGVLHISDEPAETLIGGSWPCRLFEVEPRSALISEDGHKHGCTQVKVVKELPAWMALGPNGEAAVAHIERCKTITADEAARLCAARNAAWDAAWDAAWNAARNAARNAAGDAAGDAAWDAAWDAARDAAAALVVRDLITPEQFDLLYGPWASVFGVADERTEPA
jgi:hypothetical protein